MSLVIRTQQADSRYMVKDSIHDVVAYFGANDLDAINQFVHSTNAMDQNSTTPVERILCASSKMEDALEMLDSVLGMSVTVVSKAQTISKYNIFEDENPYASDFL